MTGYKIRIMAVGAALLFALVGTPAQAYLFNTGDTVIFNFDFTGVLPLPLISGLSDFSLAGVNGGDGATFEAFGGLNATGSSLGQISFLQLPTDHVSVALLAPDALDGVFSFEVSALQGPFEITSATTNGNAGLDRVATIDATIGSSVPEPASLALVGIGVLAAAAAIRRHGKLN